MKKPLLLLGLSLICVPHIFAATEPTKEDTFRNASAAVDIVESMAAAGTPLTPLQKASIANHKAALAVASAHKKGMQPNDLKALHEKTLTISLTKLFLSRAEYDRFLQTQPETNNETPHTTLDVMPHITDGPLPQWALDERDIAALGTKK